MTPPADRPAAYSRKMQEASEYARDVRYPSSSRVWARSYASDVRDLLREIDRQQELWSVQSRVIAALAAEVPDAVRARVLAPLREVERDA